MEHAGGQNALVPEQQRLIANRFIRFSDILNSTGLYAYLKENEAFQTGKDALASVLVGLLELNLNERFHEGLGFFERMGFLSDHKIQTHGMKVAFAKGAADFAIRSTVDLIPMLVDHVHRTHEFTRLTDFFIGWLAYLNRVPSLAVQSRIVKLYEQNYRDYQHEYFVARFEDSVDKRPGLLPPAPESLRGHPESVFMTMLGACDLSQQSTLERARELGEFLDIKPADMEDQLRIARDSGAVTSDFTGLAGFSIEAWFQDLVENLDRARGAAEYAVLNDPFHAMREQRRKVILRGGVAVGAAALTLATGPVGDVLIAASAPIILTTISADPTADQVISVMKKLADIRGQRQAPRTERRQRAK